MATRTQPTDATRRARILITGGGTGGHVYPGLAVAEALLARAPECELRFVGTKRGLESVLVPQAGHRFLAVPASGVRGLGAKARFFFVVNFLLGFVRSVFLLLAWRPDLVLGTGGYVIGPVMTAARVLRVRCVLQEQNSVPGSANRLVGRWAERIYLGFETAGRFFRAERVRVTGNPVRAAFGENGNQECAEPELAAFLQDAPAHGRVLVFGLNLALASAPRSWLAGETVSLLIQTGPRDRETVREAFASGAGERVRVEAYIRDMPAALAWADLVVSRAGAMTLAELQALGKPAVLVPFPHATDNHQLHNARDCAEAGAAVVIEDADCTAERLGAEIERLLGDEPRLAAMGRAARKMSRPSAAQDIARDMLGLLGHAPPAREEDGNDVP